MFRILTVLLLLVSSFAYAEETLDSMNRVEQLIETTDATFWIEYSKELAQSLNLAPAFYN